jgi:hypothetical protein
MGMVIVLARLVRLHGVIFRWLFTSLKWFCFFLWLALLSLFTEFALLLLSVQYCEMYLKMHGAFGLYPVVVVQSAVTHSSREVVGYANSATSSEIIRSCERLCCRAIWIAKVAGFGCVIKIVEYK